MNGYFRVTFQVKFGMRRAEVVICLHAPDEWTAAVFAANELPRQSVTLEQAFAERIDLPAPAPEDQP